MILPDVNVLLHAANSAVPQHAAAHEALTQAYRDGAVALAWPALLGFLRLSTRPGILAQPLRVEAAMGVVQRWIDHPAAQLIHPTPRHAGVLARLLLAAGRGGPLVSDAHLAALAIEHGAVLLTFDRDFERFAGLRLRHLA